MGNDWYMGGSSLFQVFPFHANIKKNFISVLNKPVPSAGDLVTKRMVSNYP